MYTIYIRYVRRWRERYHFDNYNEAHEKYLEMCDLYGKMDVALEKG